MRCPIFKVKLLLLGTKSRRGVGHSEHVTNVRWTSDSGHVVSVGGADHAVFLWRYRPNLAMIEDQPERGIFLTFYVKSMALVV